MPNTVKKLISINPRHLGLMELKLQERENTVTPLENPDLEPIPIQSHYLVNPSYWGNTTVNGEPVDITGYRDSSTGIARYLDGEYGYVNLPDNYGEWMMDGVTIYPERPRLKGVVHNYFDDAQLSKILGQPNVIAPIGVGDSEIQPIQFPTKTPEKYHGQDLDRFFANLLTFGTAGTEEYASQLFKDGDYLKGSIYAGLPLLVKGGPSGNLLRAGFWGYNLYNDANDAAKMILDRNGWGYGKDVAKMVLDSGALLYDLTKFLLDAPPYLEDIARQRNNMGYWARTASDIIQHPLDTYRTVRKGTYVHDYPSLRRAVAESKQAVSEGADYARNYYLNALKVDMPEANITAKTNIPGAWGELIPGTTNFNYTFYRSPFSNLSRNTRDFKRVGGHEYTHLAEDYLNNRYFFPLLSVPVKPYYLPNVDHPIISTATVDDFMEGNIHGRSPEETWANYMGYNAGGKDPAMSFTDYNIEREGIAPPKGFIFDYEDYLKSLSGKALLKEGEIQLFNKYYGLKALGGTITNNSDSIILADNNNYILDFKGKQYGLPTVRYDNGGHLFGDGDTVETTPQNYTGYTVNPMYWGNMKTTEGQPITNILGYLGNNLARVQYDDGTTGIVEYPLNFVLGIAPEVTVYGQRKIPTPKGFEEILGTWIPKDLNWQEKEMLLQQGHSPEEVAEARGQQYLGQLHPASGGLKEVYPEFDILTAGRGLIQNKVLDPIGNAVYNWGANKLGQSTTGLALKMTMNSPWGKGLMGTMFGTMGADALMNGDHQFSNTLNYITNNDWNRAIPNIGFNLMDASMVLPIAAATEGTVKAANGLFKNIVKPAKEVFNAYKEVLPRFVNTVKDFTGASKNSRTLKAGLTLLNPSYTKVLAKSPEIMDVMKLWEYPEFSVKDLTDFQKVWAEEAAKGPYVLDGGLQFATLEGQRELLPELFESGRKVKHATDVASRYGRLLGLKYLSSIDKLTDPVLRHIAEVSPLYLPELVEQLELYGGATESFVKDLIRRSNSYRRFMREPHTSEEFGTFNGSGILYTGDALINVEGPLRSDWNGEYGNFPGYFEGQPNLQGDISTWWDQRIPEGVTAKRGIHTKLSPEVAKAYEKFHEMLLKGEGFLSVDKAFKNAYRDTGASPLYYEWPTHQIFLGEKGTLLPNFKITTTSPTESAPKGFTFGKGYSYGGPLVQQANVFGNGGDGRTRLPHVGDSWRNTETDESGTVVGYAPDVPYMGEDGKLYPTTSPVVKYDSGDTLFGVMPLYSLPGVTVTGHLRTPADNLDKVMLGTLAAGVAPMALPEIASGAATALTNPYVDAALTSYFGAHGINDIANGRANAMTALEVMPMARLAKPLWNAGKSTVNYMSEIAPEVDTFITSPYTGKWATFGNRQYRFKPGNIGMNGVPVDSRSIPEITAENATAQDAFNVVRTPEEMAQIERFQGSSPIPHGKANFDYKKGQQLLQYDDETGTMVSKGYKKVDDVPNLKETIESIKTKVPDENVRKEFLDVSYLNAFREQASLQGIDVTELSDFDIAKILTEQYNQLSSTSSGLLKNNVLWRTWGNYAPQEYFDWQSHIGELTHNHGFWGKGNYFGTGKYGGNYSNRPYMINGIDEIGYDDALGLTIGNTEGSPELASKFMSESPYNRMVAATKNGNQNRYGKLDTGEYGIEVVAQKNEGIKSLIPDLTIGNGTTFPRDWNNPNVMRSIAPWLIGAGAGTAATGYGLYDNFNSTNSDVHAYGGPLVQQANMFRGGGPKKNIIPGNLPPYFSYDKDKDEYISDYYSDEDDAPDIKWYRSKQAEELKKTHRQVIDPDGGKIKYVPIDVYKAGSWKARGLPNPLYEELGWGGGNAYINPFEDEIITGDGKIAVKAEGEFDAFGNQRYVTEDGQFYTDGSDEFSLGGHLFSLGGDDESYRIGRYAYNIHDVPGTTLPEITVNGYAPIILDTYFPVASLDYPITGHSMLAVPHNNLYSSKRTDSQISKLPQQVLENLNHFTGYDFIDKSGSSPTYNLITNNCADATLGALNAIFGTNESPFLFTTPGDVMDYSKKMAEKFGGRSYTPKYGMVRTIIPRNKDNYKSTARNFYKYALNHETDRFELGGYRGYYEENPSVQEYNWDKLIHGYY